MPDERPWYADPSLISAKKSEYLEDLAGNPAKFWKMVSVEAIRLENTLESIGKCFTFIFGMNQPLYEGYEWGITFTTHYIAEMAVWFGDYIIREPSPLDDPLGGALYPCTAKTFAKKYKLREEEE